MMTKLSQSYVPKYQRGYVNHNGKSGYVIEANPTGNVVSAHAVFKIKPFANADIGKNIILAWGNGATQQRIAIGVRPSSHSDTVTRNKLTISSVNNAGTVILLLCSKLEVADGNYHSVCASYNAATGAFTFLIDMKAADDTGWGNRIVSTGTLAQVAGSLAMVGRTDSINSAFNGEIGFVGLHNGVYISDWTPFFHPNGQPKQLNTTTWTEWTSQPTLFEANGDMEQNLGGRGRMRRIGTIAPVFESRTLRGTRDYPQQAGGIVLAVTHPRTAMTLTYDHTTPQIIASPTAVEAITVTVDANGNAYKSGSYAYVFRATGLPAKPATTRMYQFLWRYEDVNPAGTTHGMLMNFNYQDTSNYWCAGISWNPGSVYWQFDLFSVIAGVYSSKGLVNMGAAINYPAQFLITVYDGGDSINAFGHAFETDSTDDDGIAYVSYTVGSRPLKTATGVAVTNNTDPGSNARFRSLLVIDV